MEKKDLVIVIVGLALLVGVAYGVSAYNGHRYIAVQQDSGLGAEFTEPEGWSRDLDGGGRFESPDLRFGCEGKFYTPAEIRAMQEAVQDSWEMPCFRSPIVKGSRLFVYDTGDMGMADYTLENIPDEWTDGNQSNTIRKVQRIQVDGYEAVSWEDEYGDSIVSRRNVAFIRNNNVYIITQEWAYRNSNPYPDLVDDIVASWKFKA